MTNSKRRDKIKRAYERVIDAQKDAPERAVDECLTEARNALAKAYELLRDRDT